MNLLVLIIEDNFLARRTFEQTLQRVGIKTISAANAIDGMKLFRTLRPGVVVSDIILPDQDGLETIRQIRSEANETQIIAISGGGRARNGSLLETALQFGANAVLTKPFAAADFIAMVRKCLNGP